MLSLEQAKKVSDISAYLYNCMFQRSLWEGLKISGGNVEECDKQIKMYNTEIEETQRKMMSLDCFLELIGLNRE